MEIKMTECNHHFDQFIWLGKIGEVYMQCTNCQSICKPQVNYKTNEFHTNVKPTNHDKKIYDITALEDGSFIYRKKEVI